MATFKDPHAPKGRVVFGGVAFHDGVTADISPGPDTLRLFASAGITKVKEKPEPKAEPVTEPEPKQTKPASTRKK